MKKCKKRNYFFSKVCKNCFFGLRTSRTGPLLLFFLTPFFISACSEVRRLIFSESKYFAIRSTLCKNPSNLTSTVRIRGHPKIGLFSALISNFLIFSRPQIFRLAGINFFDPKPLQFSFLNIF